MPAGRQPSRTIHPSSSSGTEAQAGAPFRSTPETVACSTPPEGRARWTLRLLADKVVELGHCPRLSHTAARKILKKTNFDRT